MQMIRFESLIIFLRLVDLFQDIDADANGTISFTEWISALLRVRKANYEVLGGHKKLVIGHATVLRCFGTFTGLVLGMKGHSDFRIGVSFLCLLLSEFFFPC